MAARPRVHRAERGRPPTACTDATVGGRNAVAGGTMTADGSGKTGTVRQGGRAGGKGRVRRNTGREEEPELSGRERRWGQVGLDTKLPVWDR